MPELPEVETTRRALEPKIVGQKITNLEVRQTKLRWPIPVQLNKIIQNQVVLQVSRRGKYLLFQLSSGTLLLHLGMSGSLKLLPQNIPPQKHDHVDIFFANGTYLRFRDPRRFGALLWTTDNPDTHALLKNLGPEPLTKDFDENYLYEKSRRRKAPIKNFLMDSKIVAGLGNIYVQESLFLAGILPRKPACKLSRDNCERLVQAIKKVLQAALRKGGTTLKDFITPDGELGYFHLKLQVYGRENKPCNRCHHLLKSKRIGMRSTVFCTYCQK